MFTTVHQTPSPACCLLADDRATQPHSTMTKARLRDLIDRYLSCEKLDERLFELSFHHQETQLRPWQPIDWDAIDREQITGISPELFLAAIAMSAEVKAIPVYSRQMWEKVSGIPSHIAAFLGSAIDEDGNLLELSLWEREERQHSAIFRQIYERLAEERLPRSDNLDFAIGADLEVDRYLFQRVISEWISVSIYLWLLSHSLRDLHHAIAQILQDKIGHLAKFWGMLRLRWGDNPDPQLAKDVERLLQAFASPQDRKNLSILPSFPLSFADNGASGENAESSQSMNVFDYLATILQFSGYYSLEIGFTLFRSLRQIWCWNLYLQAENLGSLAIVCSEGYLACDDSTILIY
ncbi:MAG: hypothetical protein J7647_32650 [Cyanobacteria bacterium SBLK]|nr:hypothetical protein [Cyanobacteria bacterium SBLK]